MGMMNVKIQCILIICTFCMQEGLSRDFEANLGADVLLQRVRRQSKPAKPVLKVTDYHVRCSVVSRYAVTTIQSSVWNQLPITKEAAFEVDLPSSAFISNFTMSLMCSHS